MKPRPNDVKIKNVLMPLDVAEWLEAEAARTRASQSSEVIRAVRERMARVEAERRAST